MATKPRKPARHRKFTATSLASLPPGDHTDPAFPGLQMRVRSNADGFARAWLLRFKFRSEKGTRIALGQFPAMSLEQARRAAQELQEKARQGIDPRRARPRRRTAAAALPAAADAHTIEALTADFLARYVRPRRRRPEYVEAILRKSALVEWKGRDARTITPGEVIALLDTIVDRGSPVAANRTAAVLGQLFRWGIHRRIVDASPVQLLFRPGGKEKPRERTLTDSELTALLSVDPLPRWERLHRAINVLLLTGVRRGELALAQWAEFDFGKARVWEIPAARTKTGKATLVPLTAWAIEELQGLKREGEGSQWVFPGAADTKQPADPKLLTRNLARAQSRFAELDVAPFTLHDLRRTCRTGLARLKIQPHIAERVLNHAQEKIAGTYDLHDYLEEKRAALTKWERHLRGLVSAG